MLPHLCKFRFLLKPYSNRIRSAHTGLLPVRGKRGAQGLQKVKELERNVQALEEAIKDDVRTASRTV